MSELMLDVSQAVELKLAFRRCGWNNAQIKTLSEGDILAKVLQVIAGQAEITYPEHLINTDAAPFIPEDWTWTVEKHLTNGIYKFSPDHVSLFLSDKQKKSCIKGHKLRKELAGKPVLNANVLDYLLAHQELIPESWKGKTIFFWGTIYRSLLVGLSVRYLHWDGSKWGWDDRWLDRGFSAGRPAAVAS